MQRRLTRRNWLRGTRDGLVACGLLCGGWGLADRWLTSTARAVEPIRRPVSGPWKLGLAGYSLRQYFTRPADAADKLDLAGFIAYCAKLGVDGAELTQYYFPADVTREQLFAWKRLAHVSGVEICGGAIGNNFTVPPGPELDKQLAHVGDWIAHYADLGAPVIRVFVGKPPAGVGESAAIDRAVAALQTACDAAGKRGVLLAIENHDFTTQVDRLLEIVAQVDSPWLGVNFDSGNFGSSADPYGDMERIAPYAVNAQLKVSVHSGAGRQPADWGRIAKILAAAGYAGYLTLEYEEGEEPYEAIPGYLDKLRRLIDDRPV